MAVWEGKAPVFTNQEELDFTNNLKGWLEGAFFRTFQTNSVNPEASRVAEAYADVVAAQAKINDARRAGGEAREGDDVDVMQIMKRKLRAQFQSATKDTTPATDDVVQIARTYSKLVDAQAAYVKRRSSIFTT